MQKHYAKRICSVSYCFGLVKDEKIIGICTFGFPPNYNYNQGKCIYNTYECLTLELNRLVINKNDEKNLLSFFLSNAIKLLPKPTTLVSYADPAQRHNGGIYQATNWIYQGEGLNLMPNYSVSLTKEPYNWIHSRTVFSRFGSHNIEKLKKAIGDTFWRMREPEKHRYVYFLGSKKENKLFINTLKHPKLTYPKVSSNQLEIEEYKVEQKEFYE